MDEVTIDYLEAMVEDLKELMLNPPPDFSRVTLREIKFAVDEYDKNNAHKRGIIQYLWTSFIGKKEDEDSDTKL